MSAELAEDIIVEKKVGGSKVSDIGYNVESFFLSDEPITIKDEVYVIPPPPPKPTIITAYHSGNYYAPYEANVVSEDTWNIQEHQYRAGRTSFTNWVDFQPFQLKEAKFDIVVNHYSLNGDRMNFNLNFYNTTGQRLGYLEYHKDSSTWSTGDYTTIEFRTNSGVLLANFPASWYSGTSYGNGYFRQTVDFTDPTNIRTFASTKTVNTHQTTNDYSVSINHILGQTAYVVLDVTYTNATYTGSTTGSGIANYITNAYDYFGPLDER